MSDTKTQGQNALLRHPMVIGLVTVVAAAALGYLATLRSEANISHAKFAEFNALVSRIDQDAIYRNYESLAKDGAEFRNAVNEHRYNDVLGLNALVPEGNLDLMVTAADRSMSWYLSFCNGVVTDDSASKDFCRESLSYVQFDFEAVSSALQRKR